MTRTILSSGSLQLYLLIFNLQYKEDIVAWIKYINLLKIKIKKYILNVTGIQEYIAWDSRFLQQSSGRDTVQLSG